MKQINVINAYSISEILADSSDLSINAKWALYTTRQVLKPHYDFQIEENKHLLEKYEGVYDSKTKQINFATIDQANEFQREHNELDDLEVDAKVDIKPVVKLSEIPGITVHQIETLEDFIEFIPE